MKGLETVTEKNSFKNLIARGKRCIVLFSGFYEWKTDNKIKQPHYVYLTNHEDNGIVKGAVDENQNSTDAKEEITSTEQEFNEDKTSVMKIAGLYDDWKDSQGRLKRTYTTLTCSSCTGFQWLHSRQPVFLTEKLADEWLDPEVISFV
jgi:putative SOS response-associated peptidase YedK